MSKSISLSENSNIVAKTLQLKYNEILQSFFSKNQESFGTDELVDTDNEMLDVVKILKYYYACPPQNSFTNILDKIKGKD